MDQDPEAGTQKLEAHEYPSQEFLETAQKYMLARYANFLLQCILQLLRVWTPTELMKNTYGLGFESAPRTALLFMRSMHMPNAAAQRLKKLKRHLYARMLEEDEQADLMRQVIESEWKRDRLSGLQERVHQWVAANIPSKIKAGTLPRTNVSIDMSKQWDHVWQVLGFPATLLRFRISWAHLSSFVVNRIPHIHCRLDAVKQIHEAGTSSSRIRITSRTSADITAHVVSHGAYRYPMGIC